MNRSLSLYLDAARFSAALAVVFAHLDEIWAPGVFPFFGHLGLEAVGVFFVLSGFVIGYVCDGCERAWPVYTLNRAARLYSVVVPCLLLTLLLDIAGRYIAPDYAASQWPDLGSGAHEVATLLFSLTFLNSVWTLGILPGSDAPFWSLGYEVTYYAIFGAAVFGVGRWRIAVPVALCVLAGPKIVALLPLWGLGLLVYRVCRNATITVRIGRLVLWSAAILWLALEVARWKFQVGTDAPQSFTRDIAWQMYAAGLPFAATIIGFRFSAISFPTSAAAVTRWLAGSTFTLYLLHWPVARFLDGVLPDSLTGVARWAALLAGAVIAAFVVARYTEQRKADWRRAIQQAIRQVRPGFAWTIAAVGPSE